MAIRPENSRLFSTTIYGDSIYSSDCKELSEYQAQELLPLIAYPICYK